MRNRGASDPGGYDGTTGYRDDGPPAPGRSSPGRVLLVILALLLGGVALLALYAYRLRRATSATTG